MKPLRRLLLLFKSIVFCHCFNMEKCFSINSQSNIVGTGILNLSFQGLKHHSQYGKLCSETKCWQCSSYMTASVVCSSVRKNGRMERCFKTSCFDMTNLATAWIIHFTCKAAKWIRYNRKPNSWCSPEIHQVFSHKISENKFQTGWHEKMVRLPASVV